MSNPNVLLIIWMWEMQERQEYTSVGLVAIVFILFRFIFEQPRVGYCCHIRQTQAVRARRGQKSRMSP